MVRRLFPSPHVAVDTNVDQAVAGLRRQQEMVYPQSPVLLPGAGLIVPKGVLAGRVADGAQRVREPQTQQRLKAFAGGRPEQRVVDPGRRIVDVAGGWNDVEVSGEHQ